MTTKARDVLFLLFCLFISSLNGEYIVCSNATDSCSCSADSKSVGEPCILNCDAPGSCTGQTFRCRTGDECQVHCVGDGSCSQSINIVGNTSSNLYLYCAHHSCSANTTIACGSGQCLLACDSTSSCASSMSLSVIGFESSSYRCIGDCPHDVLLSFNRTAATTTTTGKQNPVSATSAPISQVLADQFQVFIGMNAHPLYYVIAAFFVLIALMCCVACCCLVHSHRKARALLAQQQRALELDSRLFHLNEPDDTQCLEVPHPHHKHSYAGLVCSTTPSLDVEQTVSPPPVAVTAAATAAAPRIYRLASSDITSNTQLQLQTDMHICIHNTDGPARPATDDKLHDGDDAGDGPETSTSNQETSVSSQELREQVREQLKSDPSDATLTTFQHASQQSPKTTSNGMYELMGNLLKVHERKVLTQNLQQANTSVPGYRAQAACGRSPFTALETYKKPRSFTTVASSNSAHALHRYPYPCPSSNRSAAYAQYVQYTPTDVIPVIHPPSNSVPGDFSNGYAHQQNGVNGHERTRSRSLNCDANALTPQQQQAMQQYRTGMCYGYNAALQYLQLQQRFQGAPPPPPPPLHSLPSLPSSAPHGSSRATGETTEVVMHGMFQARKKIGGKHKRVKGSRSRGGKNAYAYEYNSMDSADYDDDGDEDCDGEVNECQQPNLPTQASAHAYMHPPLPPLPPLQKRKKADVSEAAEDVEARGVAGNMESTPLMIQVSSDKAAQANGLQTHTKEAELNVAAEPVQPVHSAQESEVDEKKLNPNMWLSPASNQSKNGLEHFEQFHSPLSAPMHSNRLSQSASRTSTNATKPVHHRLKLVENHGRTTTPTDLKSNSTVIEDTYLKYI